MRAAAPKDVRVSRKLYDRDWFKGALAGALLGASFFLAAYAAHTHIPSHAIDLTSFHTHSRLSIRVDSGVDTQWKLSEKGFELVFKGISLVDLGAPFGHEEAWAKQFRALKDRRLASIEVSDTPQGVRIIGTWKYPSGDDAPVRPAMDTFDFRQSSPGRYVLDFWHRAGATVAEARAAEIRSKKERAKQTVVRIQKARAERKRALANIKAKAEELDSYCGKTFEEAREVVLPFSPVHPRVDFSQWFALTTPDSDYPYLEPSSAEKDAEYARLALKLYRGGNPALSIRTTEFLDKEFPGSRYANDMKFLRANAMIRLGMETEAQRILQEVALDQKGAPAALYSAMYLAGKAYNKGEFLNALERFLWLVQYYPDHRLAWVFHLGAAECLYELKQTDRAIQEYQWVVENTKDRKTQAQAAFRQGDAFLDRQQYEQALAAYYKAAKLFGPEIKDNPDFYLNRGETLYSLGQFDRAKELFTEYLERYAAATPGWRATYRLAEIAARKKGADSIRESRDRYAQTINQYPLSVGTVLARLRLMSCDDRGGFSFEAADRFFKEELSKLDSSREVDLSRAFDFLSIAKTRAYIAFGKLDSALAVVSDALDKKILDSTREEMATAFKRILRASVLEHLAAGRAYEALAVFEKFAPTMPKQGDDVPFDFVLKLSESAAVMNLGTVAAQLAGVYAEHTVSGRELAAATGGAVSGAAKTPEAIEADLERSLQLSEVSMAKARAAWIEKGMERENDIRGFLAQIADESPRTFEKELLLSVIEDRKKSPKLALSHGLKGQLLLGRDGSAPGGRFNAATRVQVDAWVAELQRKAGNLGTAAQMYEDLKSQIAPRATDGSEPAADPLISTLGLPRVPSRMELGLASARVHEAQGRWIEAVASYDDAVKEGLSSQPALYAYALTLRKTGRVEDVGRANEILKRVAETPQTEGDAVWRKLAAEALQGTKEGEK